MYLAIWHDDEVSFRTFYSSWLIVFPLLFALAFVAESAVFVALGEPVLAIYQGAFAALFFAMIVALVLNDLDTLRARRRLRARLDDAPVSHTPAPRSELFATYRSAGALEVSPTRARLRRLSSMLDRSDRSERFLAAEVARRLGEYEEAIALTEGEDDV